MINMVSTTQIKLDPALQPFISCYALRVFDTRGQVMLQPMHVVQESYMTCFSKQRLCATISANIMKLVASLQKLHSLIIKKQRRLYEKNPCLCTLILGSAFFISNSFHRL